MPRKKNPANPDPLPPLRETARGPRDSALLADIVALREDDNLSMQRIANELQKRGYGNITKSAVIGMIHRHAPQLIDLSRLSTPPAPTTMQRLQRLHDRLDAILGATARTGSHIQKQQLAR